MDNDQGRTPQPVVRRVLQGADDDDDPPSSTASSATPTQGVSDNPTQRLSGIPTQMVTSNSPRSIRVRTLDTYFGSPVTNENIVEISPRKRKSATPTTTPSKRRTPKKADPVTSDDEDSEEDKLEEAVDPFSIHRLNMDKLRSVSYSINTETEEKMIEKLMIDVNSKYGKESSRKFINSAPQAVEQTQNSHNFRVVAYVQKITHRDKFLRQLGIYETVQRINKIVFYIRENEIFVITTGPCWHIIQSYCDYEFPYIISGRIASRDGSFQESLKPLTGNVIMRRTTTKNATSFDQFSNIRYHSTKEIRSNASIFWLKEFKPDKPSTRSTEEEEEERPPSPSSSTPNQKKFKLNLGMAYLRIQKQMKLANVPELLDYFSKICRNEKTHTYPANEAETHFDDLPMIRRVSSMVYKECDEQILSIFHKFMHNERQDILKEFELGDKHVEDFCTASNFTLKYCGNELHTFPTIPLVIDLFRGLRRTCENLTGAKNFDEFQTRFSNVKVEYEVSGGKTVERKLLDLIECEINRSGTVYMKTIGNWFALRDGFHYKTQQMFYELLNKDGLLLSDGDPGFLKNKWDKNTMHFLNQYISSYSGDGDFFIPPQFSEDGKNPFVFDLMQVVQGADGVHSIFIYHIFPSFDTKIRGASTRLEMFLETLNQTEKKGGSDGEKENLSQSLSEVYSSQSTQDSFRELFPSFEMFRQTFLETGKVTFVAAFRTSQEKVVPEYHPFMQPDEYAAANAAESRIPRSLQHEKNLQLCFNRENIQALIVNELEQSSGDKICDEEAISPAEVASTIMEKLLKNGWCKNMPDRVEHTDKPVSDKLLTLRSSRKFKLFKNEAVNEEIYWLIRPYFISHFPGILHKLECMSMHNSTIAHSLPRLNFKIMDILDTDG